MKRISLKAGIIATVAASMLAGGLAMAGPATAMTQDPSTTSASAAQAHATALALNASHARAAALKAAHDARARALAAQAAQSNQQGSHSNAVTIAAPSSPSSGSSCRFSNVTLAEKDSTPRTFNGAWYCDNFKYTPIHSDTNVSSSVINHMNAANNNWVVCVKQGGLNDSNGSSDYNHYWAWTLGDHGTQWGWMPLTFIKQGGNDNAAGIGKICNF